MRDSIVVFALALAVFFIAGSQVDEPALKDGVQSDLHGDLPGGSVSDAGAAALDAARDQVDLPGALAIEDEGMRPPAP